MGKFSRKSREGDVEVLEKTKIGELWYAVSEWNGKPTLNIFTDRDENRSLFRFQQFPKAEVLVEAATVIEHFAEKGTLPKTKAKAKKVEANDE